jgi:hypothetical protein
MPYQADVKFSQVRNSDGMGAIMNVDHALIGMGSLGLIFGYLLGYAKGHEHGKIQGKINARRLIKAQTQHQVSR